MMGLTRWSPWTELAGLHRDLDSLFGRYFSDTPQVGANFTPAANIVKDGDKWSVHMAMPGIAPENVTIEVQGRTLRVSGERSQEEKGERKETYLNEIVYGKFEREFTLPDDIDADHVQASFRNGVLELSLPLKESAKPRRISIATPEAKQLKAA